MAIPMLKLPKSIRVGYKTYQVEEWDKDVAKASKRYGECDHLETTIRVDVTHGGVETMNTLIHEILHVVFAVTGIHDSKEWEEEYLVTTQANCLTQVLIDNPSLVKFISEASA